MASSSWPGPTSPRFAFVSRSSSSSPRTAAGPGSPSTIIRPLLMVGSNVHPAAFIDPQTGVVHLWPSSSWAAMTRAFRLGFAFLEAMSEPEPLFDAATKLVIERGDFHLVRIQ